MSLETLCYAAPTEVMREYVKLLSDAGYEVRDAKDSMLVRAYYDGDVIFTAVEVKPGFWACRGDDRIIKSVDKADQGVV